MECKSFCGGLCECCNGFVLPAPRRRRPDGQGLSVLLVFVRATHTHQNLNWPSDKGSYISTAYIKYLVTYVLKLDYIL